MKLVPGEVIEQMCASDRVTMRDRGVIARFLERVIQEADQAAKSSVDYARELIHEQIDAGLVTFIRDDLDTFITDVKENVREAAISRASE